MDNKEYVESKIESKVFNMEKVIADTKVSRFIIKKIQDKKEVKPYVIDALANYFRKQGE